MDPDPSITLLGEFECPAVKVPTQWGNTNLTFFKRKIENTDLLMGAKFESKTHLVLDTFFLFLVTFFAGLASKFEKSTNRT